MKNEVRVAVFLIASLTACGGTNKGDGDTTSDAGPDAQLGPACTSGGKGGTGTVIAVIELPELDGSRGTHRSGIKVSGTNFLMQVGASVAVVGDTNADGYDDFAFGAPGSPHLSYLIYGADVATLDAFQGNGNAADDNGKRILDTGTPPNAALSSAEGYEVRQLLDANAFLGFSVTGGDVDGDGFADWGVAWHSRIFSPTFVRQSAHVLFGGRSAPPSPVDLTMLKAGLPGATLGSTFDVDYQVGRVFPRLAANGDYDGDGRADLMVGLPVFDVDSDSGATPPGVDGKAYVVFGNSREALDALDPLLSSRANGAGQLTLDGPETSFGGASDTLFAQALNNAGDVNGDGIDDMLFGAVLTGGEPRLGAAYVIYGDRDRTALQSIESQNLNSLDGSRGFAIKNSFATRDSTSGNTATGYSVSSAGDFNGDGIDDFVVGNPGLIPPRSMVAVVFGRTGGFSNFDLNDLKSGSLEDIAFLDRGFQIISDPGSHDGIAVSAAGDVNGDGFDDVLIGARSDVVGTKDASYVLFGTNDLKKLLTLADANAEWEPETPRTAVFAGLVGSNFADSSSPLYGAGVVLRGAADSVSGQGDVNGDGFDDILIGDPDATGYDELSGEMYVVYGQDFSGQVGFSRSTSATANNQSVVGTIGDDELSAGDYAGVVLRGGAGNDTLRVNLLSCRDQRFSVNGGGDTFSNDGTGGSGDTLSPTHANQDLDFTAFLPEVIAGNRATISNRIHGIENIDLRGFGTNRITLDALKLLDISDQHHVLRVFGDSSDVLVLTDEGWAGSSETISFEDSLGDGVEFDAYRFGNTVLRLYVQRSVRLIP